MNSPDDVQTLGQQQRSVNPQTTCHARTTATLGQSPNDVPRSDNSNARTIPKPRATLGQQQRSDNPQTTCHARTTATLGQSPNDVPRSDNSNARTKSPNDVQCSDNNSNALTIPKRRAHSDNSNAQRLEGGTRTGGDTGSSLFSVRDTSSTLCHSLDIYVNCVMPSSLHV